ncbi:MAG: AAA family ATPase [Dehalococcoidia bacterium]
MVKKIVSIRNVGRFRNHNAAGDVDLKRYTLVFAENGRGKTTFCSILRSLHSGDPSYVIGRTMLGSDGSPEVRILLDGGITEFSNGAWSSTLPNLEIFDAHFVSENVYSGDAVDIEHRRSLYRVIVGEEGVALARRIDDLDAASRAKATEIRQKGQQIQEHVPQGIGLDDFLDLDQDPDVDSKIEAAERERDAVRQVAQIRDRALLSELALPRLPDGVETLLASSLDGVADDAERRVKEQISVHEMQARGESWLSEGMGYVRHDKCPFCNQTLGGAASLMAAYRAFFSDAYGELSARITAMRDRVASELGDRRIAERERIISENDAGLEFWSRYTVVTPPTLSGELEPDEILRTLRLTSLSLLDRKQASPLVALTPDQAFSDAQTAYSTLESQVARYNAAVVAANAVIESKKAATEAADLGTIEAALSRLRAKKKRWEADVQTMCAAYKAAQGEKTTIEGEKSDVRAELDNYTARVIEQYEQAINQLLEDFNAGFRITGTTHGYPGGIASSSYQILINNTPVPLGDAGTPLDQPSFKNTLSSGDRSTLALAFFLAQLERDPALSAKIVVFDDPFTSQDSFRRDCTVQKIRRCGEAASQVIVLSHNQRFLKLLWDRLGAQAANRKCLEMTRVGQRDTTICEWDIEEATQAAFNADRKALKGYSLYAEGTPREIVQKIRPVLESHCRYVAGGLVLPTDTLGVIVGKVRNTGPSSILHAVLDELDDLNEYTRRYHHGENQNAATEPIDETELLGFVKRTLNIAGGT